VQITVAVFRTNDGANSPMADVSTPANAGNLHAAGAKGGPEEIFAQEFHVGINDNFGDSQTHAGFSPMVFTIFDRWADLAGRGNGRRGGDYDGDDRDHDRDDRGHKRSVEEARASIARGQALFNTHPITISGVSGINDEAAFGKPAALTGTCSTCHDSRGRGLLRHPVPHRLHQAGQGRPGRLPPLALSRTT
jgi:hypothetical protein